MFRSLTGSNYSSGGVLKRIIHLVLSISIALAPAGFASANTQPAQNGNMEVALDEILKSQESATQASKQGVGSTPANTVVIEGLFADTSLSVQFLDADLERIKRDIIEEVREELGIPKANFFKEVVGMDKVERTEVVVDTAQFPNFFPEVKKRFKEAANQYHQEQARLLQQEQAANSLKLRSEKRKNWQLWTLRSGTSFFLISMIVEPSNLAAVTTAASVMMGNFLYIHTMAGIEKRVKEGENVLKLPTLAMKGMAYPGKITDFLKFSKEALDFGAHYYETKIANTNLMRMTAQMGSAFTIAFAITSIYTIGINIGEMGFAQTAAASGNIYEGTSFNWEMLKSAFSTEFANAKISAMMSSALNNHDLLLKTALLTFAFETWTVARMKLRSIYSDQTKVNAIGRWLGFGFALFGPAVQSSVSAFKHGPQNMFDVASILSISAMGIGGLIYVYGDTAKVHDRFLNFTDSSTAKIKEMARITKRNTRNLLASAHMGMINLSQLPNHVYKSVPKRLQLESPVEILEYYLKTKSSVSLTSCRRSFL